MLSQAESWVTENQLDQPVDVTYETEPKLLSLARLLLVQGKFMEAQDLLIRLAESTQAAGWNGRLIEILVLHALVFQAAGNTASAHDVLLKGLKLAAPEGYMRIFLDQGKDMIQLLRDLRRSSLDPKIKHYIDRLLNTCTQSSN
jgi:LuxR family maltose regulon positive regulatory protein